LLKDEIVVRYYYQKGAIRAAINDDKGIKIAIEKLNSGPDYAAYFKPGTVISRN
jgi:carboxyl-terminal processing protease